MTFAPDSAHLRHDPQLVAGHASNDLAPADAERVAGWLRDCADCAALHADLRVLSSALATLPRLANAPRDFRLSPAQAARLRGGPWWRRLARSITAPRGVGRPLATAFTTLGLVGILVGSLPVGFMQLAAVTGDRLGSVSTEGAGAPVASPTDADNFFAPADGSGGGDGEGRGSYQVDGAGGGATPPTKDDPSEDLVSNESRDASATWVSPVFALAAAFLAIGLGLFALRRFGRNFA